MDRIVGMVSAVKDIIRITHTFMVCVSTDSMKMYIGSEDRYVVVSIDCVNRRVTLSSSSDMSLADTMMLASIMAEIDKRIEDICNT